MRDAWEHFFAGIIGVAFFAALFYFIGRERAVYFVSEWVPVKYRSFTMETLGVVTGVIDEPLEWVGLDSSHTPTAEKIKEKCGLGGSSERLSSDSDRVRCIIKSSGYLPLDIILTSDRFDGFLYGGDCRLAIRLDTQRYAVAQVEIILNFPNKDVVFARLAAVEAPADEASRMLNMRTRDDTFSPRYLGWFELQPDVCRRYQNEKAEFELYSLSGVKLD